MHEDNFTKSQKGRFIIREFNISEIMPNDYSQIFDNKKEQDKIEEMINLSTKFLRESSNNITNYKARPDEDIIINSEKNRTKNFNNTNIESINSTNLACESTIGSIFNKPIKKKIIETENLINKRKLGSRFKIISKDVNQNNSYNDQNIRKIFLQNEYNEINFHKLNAERFRLNLKKEFQSKFYNKSLLNNNTQDFSNEFFNYKSERANPEETFSNLNISMSNIDSPRFGNENISNKNEIVEIVDAQNFSIVIDTTNRTRSNTIAFSNINNISKPLVIEECSSFTIKKISNNNFIYFCDAFEVGFVSLIK